MTKPHRGGALWSQTVRDSPSKAINWQVAYQG
jgi:hypothetical protein